jgi:hypothetical protein
MSVASFSVHDKCCNYAELTTNSVEIHFDWSVSGFSRLTQLALYSYEIMHLNFLVSAITAVSRCGIYKRKIATPL